jgi:glycosyl transferase family 2
MLLSIVMPSHGSDLHVYSRIAHACSFASDEVEVVVRDNSGVAAKRDYLKLLEGKNRKLISVPECGPFENFSKALDASTGKFLFIVSDDDFFFDRAIDTVVAAASAYEDDHTVAGFTGTYMLEMSSGSQYVNYRGLDSRDASERVSGYLDYQGPNLIGYAVVRREVALDAWRLAHAHPIEFSFHDQTIALLTLLAGRFIHINRLLFMYDNAHWEIPERCIEEDLKFYTRAGMDPAFGRLHWLVLAFEGARLISNSWFGSRLPLQERQRATARWFQTMFARFVIDNRSDYGSKLTPEADALIAKWRGRYPNFQLDELLNDICAFMARFAPDKAQRYRDFWVSLSQDVPKAISIA